MLNLYNRKFLFCQVLFALKILHGFHILHALLDKKVIQILIAQKRLVSACLNAVQAIVFAYFKSVSGQFFPQILQKSSSVEIPCASFSAKSGS